MRDVSQAEALDFVEIKLCSAFQSTLVVLHEVVQSKEARPRRCALFQAKRNVHCELQLVCFGSGKQIYETVEAMPVQ